MFTCSARVLLALCSVASAACASTNASNAAPATAAQPAPTASELHGVWAEYWSVQGAADTQRYVFLEDGRFAWLAPAQSAPSSLIRKTGTFALERSERGDVLVLNVSSERFAACAPQCAHHDEGPRTVAHTAPLSERYEIGECAPNQEAQALDSSYACRAIGGRAFWRRSASELDTGVFE